LKKNKISIVSPCFNEQDNILNLYDRLKKTIGSNDKYEYELIFIDNKSLDSTVTILKNIASKDLRVKLIINNKNYGHIRSPYWGLLQATGDAVILIASDLQDPPENILQFIKEWELGWKVVYATKQSSKTNLFMHTLRRIYYFILNKISEGRIIKDATGFGLYDKKVIDIIREINDPYPFLRGLVSELGFPIKTIPFVQPKRLEGVSKNNIFTLYDIALLGLVSHSLLPIRIVSFIGFAISIISFMFAVLYLILKIFFWDSFPIGIAPLVISIFLLFGLLFIFLGIIGEYIAIIVRSIQNRPIVVEELRINFDKKEF
jgi:dolichol-phosphate mannosyltransferase